MHGLGREGASWSQVSIVIAIASLWLLLSLPLFAASWGFYVPLCALAPLHIDRLAVWCFWVSTFRISSSGREVTISGGGQCPAARRAASYHRRVVLRYGSRGAAFKPCPAWIHRGRRWRQWCHDFRSVWFVLFNDGRLHRVLGGLRTSWRRQEFSAMSTCLHASPPVRTYIWCVVCLGCIVCRWSPRL